VVQYYLLKENVQTAAMFQYMIGNDDWYVPSKNTVSILKLNTTDQLIAIPYDFVWSKLVNAKYTKQEGAHENYLSDRRVYKGLCLEISDFEYKKQIFLSRKETIFQLLNSIDDLPKQQVQESVKYIGKFYKTTESKLSFENFFQKEK